MPARPLSCCFMFVVGILAGCCSPPSRLSVENMTDIRDDILKETCLKKTCTACLSIDDSELWRMPIPGKTLSAVMNTVRLAVESPFAKYQY